jgi:hypothetical protein
LKSLVVMIAEWASRRRSAVTSIRDSQDVGWIGEDRNGSYEVGKTGEMDAVDDTLPIVFGAKLLQMPYAGDHIKSGDSIKLGRHK